MYLSLLEGGGGGTFLIKFSWDRVISPSFARVGRAIVAADKCSFICHLIFVQLAPEEAKGMWKLELLIDLRYPHTEKKNLLKIIVQYLYLFVGFSGYFTPHSQGGEELLTSGRILLGFPRRGFFDQQRHWFSKSCFKDGYRGGSLCWPKQKLSSYTPR